jgi:hypothetical protein
MAITVGKLLLMNPTAREGKIIEYWSTAKTRKRTLSGSERQRRMSGHYCNPTHSHQPYTYLGTDDGLVVYVTWKRYLTVSVVDLKPVLAAVAAY